MTSFRPLFRGCFLFEAMERNEYQAVAVFPSPLPGMFFIRSDGKKRISSRRRVSVPSSGDVFYLHLETYSEVEKKHCFRPLFWGCFLFQLMKWAKKAWTKSGFRPLFRGCFLFVYNDRPHDNGGNKRVSVPSFGDVFYSRTARVACASGDMQFPSPLSGMFFISHSWKCLSCPVIF